MRLHCLSKRHIKEGEIEYSISELIDTSNTELFSSKQEHFLEIIQKLGNFKTVLETNTKNKISLINEVLGRNQGWVRQRLEI